MTNFKDYLTINLNHYITNNNIFIFFILLFTLFLLYISKKIGKKKNIVESLAVNVIIQKIAKYPILFVFQIIMTILGHHRTVPQTIIN